MGTPAAVAKVNQDGTVSAIRINYDGYPDYMANLLVGFYSEEEKIDEMLKMGEFSSLDNTLERSKNYHRDYGEKLRPAKRFTSVEDFSKNAYGEMGADYLYFFDGTHWNLVDKEDHQYSIELNGSNVDMF